MTGVKYSAEHNFVYSIEVRDTLTEGCSIVILLDVSHFLPSECSTLAEPLANTMPTLESYTGESVAKM